MTSTRTLRLRTLSVAMTALLLGIVAVTFQSPQESSASTKCSTMTKKVHLFIDTKRDVSALTYKSKSFSKLKKSGYTDQGVAFLAASKTRGLSAVHAMYLKSNHDRIYTTSKSEIKALKKKGYRDDGVSFYVAKRPGSCLTPVYQVAKQNIHRLVLTSADRSRLAAQGWSSPKTMFWTRAKPTKRTGNAFTIAVMPDTQDENTPAGDTRFVERTKWLVQNRSNLDLKFVTHVGDVVNWDTPDHIQYQRAASGLKILNDANIPYSLSPGNHDTAAVCQGGSACPHVDVLKAVRDTTTFNKYLNHGVADVQGYFEPGKVDNTYSRFEAGGRRWLVLNLELWPRPAAVAWAKRVVAGHPHDNVIVVTHSYLTAAGGIYQSNGGYGATSPRYLYKNLISKYPNIRLVFSGHVGKSAHRIDHGVKGNRIDSFLLCMHDKKTNPTRLVQINPSTGQLKTWVYAPRTKQRYPKFAYSTRKISWVR